MIEVNEVIDKKHVPRIIEDYSIIPYDSNVFTLCIEAVRPIKLNIDSHTKRLLEQIDGYKNLEEVTHGFNSESPIKLTVNDTIEIIKKRIVGFGILEGDNVEKIKIKDDYLRLRFTLFPTDTVAFLASGLKFLYNETLFKFLFAAAFTFLFFSFFFFLNFQNVYDDLDPAFLTLIVVVNFTAVIIHEFGHAAACLKFGAKNGPIGFGFYIISPVLYSDVTDAWRLSREHRIIVDLGGIYVQMLLTCLVTFVYFYTNNDMYLQLAFWMAVTTAINLSPFLRYDGYWALSDIMRISNLKEKSQFAANSFFGWVIGMNKTWKYTKDQRFLLIYGMARTLVLLLFLSYLLFFRSDSLLLYPQNLMATIDVIINDFGSINFDWIKETIVNLFIPTVFFVVLTREAIKFIKKKLKKT